MDDRLIPMVFFPSLSIGLVLFANVLRDVFVHVEDMFKSD